MSLSEEELGRAPDDETTSPEHNESSGPVSSVQVSREELSKNAASFDTATRLAHEARVNLHAAIHGALEAGLTWAEIGLFVDPVLSAPAAAVGQESATSLSALESQLVDLVATGMTNQSVADRLYVSKRTLEVRLTALYRKFGVRGKSDLLQRLNAAAPRDRSGQ